MRLLCITGMHRSGTSAVARLLNLMGVDLGPESELMEPSEANPRGYWEAEPISELNERILEHLNGRWHRLPVFREGWQHDRDLNPFRRRARDLIAELFDGSEIAGWKDPRNSVLLPFWRTVTRIDSTVLVVRDPGEVIASLNRRDGMDPRHAATLWTRYTLSAAVHAPDHVLVRYSALFEDLAPELERLADRLDLPAPDDDLLLRAREFLDPGLRRQSDPGLFSGPEVALAFSVYATLQDDARRSELSDLYRELHESFLERDRLEADLRHASDRADALRQVEKELEHARTGAEQARRLAAEAGRLEGRLQAAHAELRAREERVRSLETELGNHRTEIEQLERRAEELESESDELRRRLVEEEQTYQNRVRSLERQLQRTRRDFERLRQRRSVRSALAVAELFRPIFRLVRGWKRRRRTEGTVQQPAGEDVGQTITEPRRATREEQEKLERRIVAALPDTAMPSVQPKVSIVILNRSGEHHLRRLFPRLENTDYDDLEVIVVDNASEDGSVQYLLSLETRFPLEVVQNDENRSFSEANNQGIARADGELVLLLNNDIEPFWPGWLRRMVATMERTSAGAVGARLVYPARPGLDNAGDEEHPDLTLQHRGIHFTSDPGGVPRARNLGSGEDPTGPHAAAVHEVAALTAACLLVRKQALEKVGGLSEGYRYGTEDVDLCLKLRDAGYELVYDGGAALWHHEFGTQNIEGRTAKRENRLHNRDVFVGRWGRRVFREVFRSKIAWDQRWSTEPLHVAITITKDDPRAGYGDWFTAHELGDALETLGWRVSYVERYDERWYDLDPSTDVLLVLLDAFELPKVPRGIVSVAWVRNWTDRWISRPWFDDYDIVLASSARSKEIIEERSAKSARLFPLATNPDRFSSSAASPVHDAVFVGSYWEEPRRIAEALPQVADELDIRVYGHGWHKTRALERFAPEPAEYADLPEIYTSANVVIDDTAHHARPYEAVNARVFDALAAGSVVISDNEPGIREMFDDEFPTWSDAEELEEWITTLRDDPRKRQEIQQKYRSEVLRSHTYERRATQLREILRDWVDSQRFGICIGVPEREQSPRWGDYHFARAIQRQLEHLGHPTRIFLLPEWEEEFVSREDVLVHLFGLSEYKTQPGQLNLMWNISHPERVSVRRCDTYDAVFVASERFAEELRSSVTVPVHTLYQATDPDRFYPDPDGPHHDLLFVGNSRRVRRRIIDDLAGTGYDLAVYGSDWTRDLIDQRHVRGEHVPNEELRRYYSSAKIVLNDHWDDMREHGFISNRIYDALACGAVVVSDHVAGIEEHLEGCVVTYRSRDELLRHIDRLLEDAEERQRRGDRGRETVVSQHTFAHRVRTMLEVLEPRLDQLPAGIGGEFEAPLTPSAARSVAS